MTNGIATDRLNEESLETYLNFPIWREQATECEVVAEPPTNEELRSDQERIHELLGRERGGWLGDAPFTLNKPLLIAAILGRASNEQYLALSDICDALRIARPPCVACFDDSDAWQEAIAVVRRRRSPNIGLGGHNPRAQAVARSILRLEAAGFPVQVTTFGSSLAPETLQAVCGKISDGVRRIGGWQFADAIFGWLAANGRTYHGSLLYGRSVDHMGRVRDPSVPWHYLYNLALRHFDARPGLGVSQADFISVAELARDMAAVFDVEMYTVYENMAVGHTSFHHNILDRVIYDELFAFQQWQPEVAVRLLGSLLGHLKDRGCKIPLASPQQWTAFGEQILRLSAECGLSFRHPSECLSPSVTVEMPQKLFDALAIPFGEVNCEYMTPLDTQKRNAPLSPYYRYLGDIYVLPHRAIVARGLYEGLYTLLRKHNPATIENWLGEALEELTADAIAQFGHRPSVVHERYRIPGQLKREPAFDIDVAELTDRHVFLFECKKKALTNSARAGNTLAAAVDFARGFLHPLVQANRHEMQLRAPSGLTLLNGETLRLNDRIVQRIAVTMTDHGSMQARSFLRAMIRALWGTTLTSADPAFKEYTAEINREVLALTNGIMNLASLAGESLENYTPIYAGGCWFLSIDQLYFLCSSGTDLWSAISPLGSITYGTGDIMTELSYSDRSGLLSGLRAQIHQSQSELR